MAFQLTGEINLSREIDPMLAAVADFIATAGVLPNGADLTDFHEKNVTVIAPEATAKQIEAHIQNAVAKHKGLSLLVIAGGGKNPDKTAPGPRMAIEVELQLYVHPKLRPKAARTALELVVALLRGLHDAEIRVNGFPWFEQIIADGFEPLPDESFTAYSLTFEREMQF